MVKLDGKPLADADVAIYFQGAPPQGYYGSGGKTDAEGKFQLQTGAVQGALPGSYKVTVSRITDPGGKPVVVSEGMDIEQLKAQGQAIESLPAKYANLEQTDLTLSIEKGKADGYDLELKSQ